MKTKIELTPSDLKALLQEALKARGVLCKSITFEHGGAKVEVEQPWKSTAYVDGVQVQV